MATILVVDDTPDFRLYLLKLLDARGRQVLEADDGAAALTAVRAYRPSLVIADVLMPTMDGYEFVRQLRADPALAQTPVIFYSAHYSEHEARNLAESCGVIDVLAKSAAPEAVLHTVDKALRLSTPLMVAPPPIDFEQEHLQLLTDKLSQTVAQLEARAAELEREVTERRRAEEALRESEERFRSAFEHTNIATVLTDLDNRFLRVNRAFAGMFGYSPGEMAGMSLRDITHPEFAAESLARREELLRGTNHFFQMEKRYLHKDGHTLWGLTNVALVRDARGQPLYYVGQVQDITARKESEERFRQQEQQLRQAQKMEAFGSLAGGVAHDFNNLLTVILGYSDILLNRLPPDDALHKLVREIKKAGDRATALTRQLLAFSRQQILEPVVLDLNVVITDISKMLRRIIGEDVRLATHLAKDLLPVRADPGQVEQVVMNLAVNARDAMPTGGCLTIETRNVELDESYVQARLDVRPGSYAMMAISDTGCGIPPEVRSRIFEPFFTTKEVGKGTGLGLATVYGIVKQSGGHIEVYSEVAQGTTFKVYLPVIRDGVTASRSNPNFSKIPQGTETVLLVEDEEEVRSLSRMALEQSGYAVLEARDGQQALRLAETHPGPIHVLITDVVMPHMGGRKLAEHMAALRPDMKLLFLSGYTDDAVVRHGVLQANVNFLQKPFTPGALARKVRGVLDG